MALWRCSTVFFYMLVTSQLVHASADAIFEQNKCHCSPPVAPSDPGGSFSPPDGGILPPSTPESPPSYSPPDGGILPPSTPESPPSYSPPDDGGILPPTSVPPPSPYISSTPPPTPPYSSPHKGHHTRPPLVPSPSVPSHDPTPSPPHGGGGGGSSTPKTPSNPPCGSSSPPTPTTPSYGTPASPTTPSTPDYTPTPTTPSYGTPSSPTTPTTPDYTPPVSTGGAPLPTPLSPDVGIPSLASPPPDYSVPSSPDGAGSVPSVPDLTPPVVGSTPVVGDPGSSTGTCDFWGSHPDYLPSILTFFSSISDLFGSGFSPVFSADMTLQEALTSKRRDGYGSLFREGSASLLNSYVNKNFVFSTEEVKQKFNAALTSNHTAAVQATKFKSANEGHLLP